MGLPSNCPGAVTVAVTVRLLVLVAMGANIILPLMDLRFGALISLITRNLIALRTTYVVILAGRA